MIFIWYTGYSCEKANVTFEVSDAHAPHAFNMVGLIFCREGMSFVVIGAGMEIREVI
jgi:hypothetical protein